VFPEIETRQLPFGHGATQRISRHTVCWVGSVRLRGSAASVKKAATVGHDFDSPDGFPDTFVLSNVVTEWTAEGHVRNVVACGGNGTGESKRKQRYNCKCQNKDNHDHFLLVKVGTQETNRALCFQSITRTVEHPRWAEIRQFVIAARQIFHAYSILVMVRLYRRRL